MYCVIQEVRRKKPNPYGEHRELAAEQDGWTIDGKPPCWRWRYTGGQFERPHLEAYKISIHQSYREGGRVKKRQYSICTMSYYDIVEYSLYDCADGAIRAAADKLGMDCGELYDLIENRLEPLRERIEAEFHQSEEYQTHRKHEQIIQAHNEARAAFCERYGVDEWEYDRCYDVFGTLRNPDYLKRLKQEYKARQQAAKEERRRREQQWQETFKRYTSGGGYSAAPSSTYSAAETAMLKEFYKTLSKKYHPDLNPDRDTTAEMQLLNRLKQSWFST